MRPETEGLHLYRHRIGQIVPEIFLAADDRRLLMIVAAAAQPSYNGMAIAR